MNSGRLTAETLLRNRLDKVEFRPGGGPPPLPSPRSFVLPNRHRRGPLDEDRGHADLADYAKKFDVAVGRRGVVRPNPGPETRFVRPGGPVGLNRPDEWTPQALSELAGGGSANLFPLGGWAKSETKMEVEKKVRSTCRCDRYPFPHRRGGGRCR